MTDPTGLAGEDDRPPPPPPPPPPSPPKTDGPYEADGVTLKPVENGPYVDGAQTIVRDTTGAGDEVQAIVDSIIDSQIANDEAATARARGDKDAQERAERKAAQEDRWAEKLTDRYWEKLYNVPPAAPPLIIHPDGSVGGDPQVGDEKVSR